MDCGHSSSSSSSSAVSSRWPDLPSDVLTTLATLLGPTIGLLRLRSVCHSWRSSLPSSPPPAPHFPLPLPSLTTTTSALSLHQHTIFLLSPPSQPAHSFLLKLHPKPNNTFTLLNPTSTVSLLDHRADAYAAHHVEHSADSEVGFGFRVGRCPLDPTTLKLISTISLLDYRVVFVSYAYAVDHSAGSQVGFAFGFGGGRCPIKKVVVQRGFFQENDFVVLGLTELGKLVFWRFGDVGWTQIGQSGRRFDDVVAYKGGFYATADQRGRLVKIDSLRVVDMVNGLMYGSGKRTSLVESDGGLYLVDCVPGDDERVEIGVFKLDDKGRFWDYELRLDDNVFFVGCDVSFAVLRRDYCGEVRNCVYFMTHSPEGDEGTDFAAVFDMERGNVVPLLGSDKYCSLYWPPSSWFR